MHQITSTVEIRTPRIQLSPIFRFYEVLISINIFERIKIKRSIGLTYNRTLDYERMHKMYELS